MAYYEQVRLQSGGKKYYRVNQMGLRVDSTASEFNNALNQRGGGTLYNANPKDSKYASKTMVWTTPFTPAGLGLYANEEGSIASSKESLGGPEGVQSGGYMLGGGRRKKQRGGADEEVEEDELVEFDYDNDTDTTQEGDDTTDDEEDSETD